MSVETTRNSKRRRGVRTVLSFYGSTPAYHAVLEVEGWDALQPELNALSKQGGWAEMANLVTDDMVDTLAVHGTPDAVAAQIMKRYGDCDRICAYFPGYQAEDDLIADFVSALKAAS